MKWLKANRNYMIIFVVLLGIELMFLYYPLNIIVFHGGQATDLAPYVQVIDGDVDDQGTLYMLSIFTSKANGALWLRAQFDDNMDLKPMNAVMPSDMTMEEYNLQMKKSMADSQKKATLLALQAAGVPVEVEGGGLTITAFTETSSMQGILQEGDILKRFEDQTLLLNEDLQRKLLQYKPGDQITLLIERNQQLIEIEGSLGQDELGNAKLGIYITPTDWEIHHDKTITFQNEEIGGGSAGMMLTLQILNQLVEEDITRGYAIAGTGTIRLDGSIGPIEGVKQKLRAAEKQGARYFLVAQDNAAEAQALAESIVVVPVSYLEEALSFLAGLPHQ